MIRRAPSEVAILVLLSPAKKLDFASPLRVSPSTRPALGSHVAELTSVAKQVTRGRWKRVMDLSDPLADHTFGRMQELVDTPEPPAARQALLTFAGDVYVGLDAKSLGEADLGWAQDHVAILSGLYGLLRPLDLVQPYRLEMGTKLRTKRGPDLYAFWRDAVTERIGELLAGHLDRTVVNLASDEYFSAVDPKRLDARVVTPVFQDVKDGKARALFLFVKRARGRMARAIVDARSERADDLRGVVVDGYRFTPEVSTSDRWVFRRPQPPPVV